MARISDAWLVALAILLPLGIPVAVVVARMIRKVLGPSACRSVSALSHDMQGYVTDVILRKYGRVWLLVQVLISFVSAGIYVVTLYMSDSSAWSPLVLWSEGIITVVILADYAFQFWMARHKLAHFASFHSLVDIYTILPFFLMIMAGVERTDPSSSIGVRAISALRVLRVLRTQKILEFSSGSLQRQMWVVSLTIFNFLFCFTCFIQLVEDSPDAPFPFHDSLWFTVISSSTVGYGDVTPSTKLGRVVVMAVVILGIVLIPTETGKLITLANQRNTYKTSAFVKRHDHDHVVVLGSGEDSVGSILGFLSEFYHEDNALHNVKMVLLLDCYPTVSLRRALSNPFFAHRVIILQGSAMNDADLARVDINSASACFIITPKSVPNAWSQDVVTVMRCVAVRAANPNITIISQLLRRDNIPHLTAAGCDYILCLDEIKMGVMASNALTPGLSTFLINLLRSFSDESVAFPAGSWESEYAEGYAQEIYSQTVTSALAGKTFAQAAHTLYKELGVTLFAVEATIHGITRIWLNPGTNYIICKDDKVFVLAPDPDSLTSVYFLAPPELSPHTSIPRLKVLENQRRAARAASHPHPEGFPPPPGTSKPLAWYWAAWEVVQSVLFSPIEIGLTTQNRHRAGRAVRDSLLLDHPEGRSRSMSYAARAIPAWVADASVYLASPYSVEESLWLDFSSPSAADTSRTMRLRFRTSFTHGSLASVDSAIDDPPTRAAGVNASMNESLLDVGSTNVWQHVYNLLDPAAARSKMDCMYIPAQRLSSHVIVAGTLSGMASFLLTLRLRKQIVQVPVIIVHDSEPSPALWHVIRRLDDVFFFKGNYMSVTDLSKAGAPRALRVVILGSQRAPVEGQPDVVSDSDAIFSARLLKRLVPRRSDLVFTELSIGDSIRYLTAELEDEFSVDSYHFARPFAAGHTFTSTILDTMLVQVFSNSDVVDIVRQTIGLGNHAMFSALSSAPYQIAVPQRLVGKPYVELVEWFTLTKGIVPLALYRKATVNTGRAPTDGQDPGAASSDWAMSRYMYTNPRAETIVRANDRVLVFASSPDDVSF